MKTIEEKVIDFYQKGCSSREIQKLLGVSKHKALEIVKKAGISIRYSRKPFDLKFSSEIIKKYEEGESMNALTKEYKATSRTLVKILKNSNVYLRDESQRRQIYDIDELFFDNIDNREKAYLLGFLWADGHNDTDHNNMMIRISSKDEHLLNLFRKWMKSSHPIYKIKDSEGRFQSKWNVKSKHISKTLLSLGMVKNKTKYPVWPSNLNPEWECDFIRGFFDGDGCWYTKDGGQIASINFSGNMELLKQVAEVIERHTNVKFYSYPTKGSDLYGHISVGGRKKLISFGDWLYQNKGEAFLERKYQKYLITKNWRRLNDR